MRSVTVCGLALGLSAAIATNANALTETQSVSFTDVSTELMDEMLTLNLFDDMGGTRTLNSVFVEVMGDISAEGTITNIAAQPQTFRFRESADIFRGTATGPASLQTLDIVPFFGDTLIGQQLYTDLGMGDSADFGPFAISGDADFLLNDAADVAEFVGAGTFSYAFNTSIAQTNSGAGGNVDTSIRTLAGATLTVRYDFDEDIPPVTVTEPGSLILMGAGLLGLVGMRKRTRQS